MKSLLPLVLMAVVMGRSRKGAWIEMFTATADKTKSIVAPVRERGLKCPHYHVILFGYESLP